MPLRPIIMNGGIIAPIIMQWMMVDSFACFRYRFELRALSRLELNSFAGATLRGGFGHVFKRSVCIWPPGDCPRCLLKSTCAYPYVFETAPSPQAEQLRGIDQVPRPFVLEPPLQEVVHQGESLPFHLILVGRAQEFFPYFLFTFSQLGQAGLGPGRGQFEIQEVVAVNGNREESVYNTKDGALKSLALPLTSAELAAICKSWQERLLAAKKCQLTIRFETPVRIVQEGKPRADLTFQDLIRALLRRLSSLCYFHCGQSLDLDFPALKEQAGTICTEASDLHWQQQGRFSGRQRRAIDMSGLVGRITFAAAHPEDFFPFLPLLAAGEWVHVGKGCVMGLGKYQVELPG